MRLLPPLLCLLVPLSPALAQRPSWQWSLEPVLRIGAVDDGHHSLTGISHIVVGPVTGAVFIGRYERLEAFDGARPSGEVEGELTLPTHLRLPYVDRDTAWGVERDELDVEYAVRFRIRG